ncbi:cell division protein FtsZ [Rhodoferax sp. BAB1]|uniref:cell division protein FtsZ n=1 Tax=Rhodoferax sp. BAB1 TaxID=2741720 RepID=UPI001575CB59|nr:cell division protein FtsZ [Rhodoferax sp. BAB1]QKO21877.1 cell division protein FtsZ [Rhodoferax sp. BAB1]
MSKLQIGLAIAGVLLLAGLVVHGAWTARRNQPRLAEPEAPPIEPHGLGEFPHEPAASALAGRADEDGLLLPALQDRKAQLDPLIDVSAAIELEHPVSGEALLQHLPATRRVGSKPYAIEGLDEATGTWEPPQPGRRYSALQAGVQLANRAGALNEIEYSEFVVKTQSLADAVGGTPEFPDMRDAVARARELDAFASEHDAQLSVTLRARQTAWSAGYVQQNAARLGFVAGVLPGRMVLPASVGGQPPVLGLQYDAQAALAEDPAQTAIRDMTLSLDVAQVARSEQPYVRLREAAKRLAEVMDGLITDDNGQPLSSDAMDLIGAELENLYDRLDEHELSAGSPLARRLFS